MSDAVRDQNHVSAILGVLDTDGSTPTGIKADPSNHRLRVNIGTAGSDKGPDNAARDDNHVTTLVAVSSVDGVTPVVVYADSKGRLKVKST